MRHTTKVLAGALLVGPLLGGSALVGLGLPAGADVTGLTTAPAPASTLAAAAVTPGRSAITKAKVFKPAHVSGPGDISGCSSAGYTALVVNNSKAAQQLTLAGSNLGSPIPAGDGEYLCSSSTKSGTVTIGLASNIHAALALRVVK